MQCSKTQIQGVLESFFSNLFNDIKATHLEDVESFNNANDFNGNSPTFLSLNGPITTDEVFKRNKSPCPI